MSRTALVDDSGVERLVYLRDPDRAPYDGLVPVQVVLRSPTYEIKARAELGPGDSRPAGLLTIAAQAQGDATYDLWGIGNYRIEGPLLTLTFAGDKRGHFRVRVSLAESSLRLIDEFQTDQSCLASFLSQLKALGEGGDA
jgi:hypothetical protein